MALYSALPIGGTRRKLQGSSQEMQCSFYHLLLASVCINPTVAPHPRRGSWFQSPVSLCPIREQPYHPRSQGLGPELLRYLFSQGRVPALSLQAQIDSIPSLGPQALGVATTLCNSYFRMTSVLPFFFSKTCLTNSLSSVFPVESPAVGPERLPALTRTCSLPNC